MNPTRPINHTQAYKGRADMVGCLLDCGAGVNECETRRARTALYLACEFDHADVVALLLRRGANQVCADVPAWLSACLRLHLKNHW